MRVRRRSSAQPGCAYARLVPQAACSQRQVPCALLHPATRGSLGLASVVAAQLINWTVLGLDGWWLLLAGGCAVWAPPQLYRGAVQAARAAAAKALTSVRSGATSGGCCSNASSIPDGGGRLAGASSSRLEERHWSRWFWGGAAGDARARRGCDSSGAQQQLHDAPAVEAAPHQHGLRRSSPDRHVGRRQHRQQLSSGHNLDRGARNQPAAAASFALLVGLVLYHVLTPLHFLLLPST